MGLFYKELYYLISDYTSAPTPISILRPHPDVLQLHLINFCTFPYVKHPKRRGLWTRVYFGVHELTSFGFASFSRRKNTKVNIIIGKVYEQGFIIGELYFLMDYSFSPPLINILRPHPDVLQLHLFNFCTFLPVKHPKRRGFWFVVSLGVHELT